MRKRLGRSFPGPALAIRTVRHLVIALGHRSCSSERMIKKPDNPATQAGKRDSVGPQDGERVPLPEGTLKDADSPSAKPHGTLRDQVATMEGEGQAQPQSDEVPPEERDGSRVIRPDNEKHTGQSPPEDVDGGPEGTTQGAKGGSG